MLVCGALLAGIAPAHAELDQQYAAWTVANSDCAAGFKAAADYCHIPRKEP